MPQKTGETAPCGGKKAAESSGEMKICELMMENLAKHNTFYYERSSSMNLFFLQSRVG